MTVHQALEQLVPGFVAIYGDLVESIILFGSTARGADSAESDVDIAVIVTPDQVKGNKIGLGSTVTFLELTGEGEGEQITVKLVSTVEADPLAEPPLVSNESLLGKALTGHTTGDHVIVDSAAPYEIQIIRPAGVPGNDGDGLFPGTDILLQLFQ